MPNGQEQAPWETAPPWESQQPQTAPAAAPRETAPGSPAQDRRGRPLPYGGAQPTGPQPIVSPVQDQPAQPAPVLGASAQPNQPQLGQGAPQLGAGIQGVADRFNTAWDWGKEKLRQAQDINRQGLEQYHRAIDIMPVGAWQKYGLPAIARPGPWNPMTWGDLTREGPVGNFMRGTGAGVALPPSELHGTGMERLGQQLGGGVLQDIRGGQYAHALGRIAPGVAALGGLVTMNPEAGAMIGPEPEAPIPGPTRSYTRPGGGVSPYGEPIGPRQGLQLGQPQAPSQVISTNVPPQARPVAEPRPIALPGPETRALQLSAGEPIPTAEAPPAAPREPIPMGPSPLGTPYSRPYGRTGIEPEIIDPQRAAQFTAGPQATRGVRIPRPSGLALPQAPGLQEPIPGPLERELGPPPGQQKTPAPEAPKQPGQPRVFSRAAQRAQARTAQRELEAQRTREEQAARARQELDYEQRVQQYMDLLRRGRQ